MNKKELLNLRDNLAKEYLENSNIQFGKRSDNKAIIEAHIKRFENILTLKYKQNDIGLKISENSDKRFFMTANYQFKGYEKYVELYGEEIANMVREYHEIFQLIDNLWRNFEK